MARLTRIERQERTRNAILAAAREEFAEHGYADAAVDRIAERADLTRGAVYSNFPGKRALYLAVLVAMTERAPAAGPAWAPATAEDALIRFARAWLDRLPPAGGADRLRLRSLAGVLDERGRDVLAQLARLEALLLAVGLESCAPGRRVRLAELALTLLSGAGHLAEQAPGFGSAADRVRACGHLAALDLRDAWAPRPPEATAEAVHEPLAAPALRDLVGGGPVDLGTDGLVAVLGTGRLAAAEDALRAAAPGETVTLLAAVPDPAETGSLVRLRVGDLTSCLRAVFPAGTWRRLRVAVADPAATAALGLPDPAADTEAALRVRGGMLAARASGPGAARAAARARRGAGA
ncbi:TetR/AcrR family transcriptional regulator [Glycomyces scopariae]